MDFNLLLVNVFQKLAARKFFFWGLFFVILMGAIAGAYVKPQRFESSTTILVTLQSSRLNTSHSEQQQLSVTLQAEELIASQIELMQTRDNEWICIYNDTEDGRHSLAVSLSDDEGRTWKWTRHLEKRSPGDGSFHYPSIIEGSDGNLHATYSYFINRAHNGEEKGKSIRYATFSKSWIKGE